MSNDRGLSVSKTMTNLRDNSFSRSSMPSSDESLEATSVTGVCSDRNQKQKEKVGSGPPVPYQDDRLEGAANLMALNQWDAPAGASRDSNILKSAWNLGIPRPLEDTQYGEFPRIRTLFTETQVRHLASVFFREIHPLFGFFSEKQFAFFVDLEYNEVTIRRSALQDFEPAICGVIALGSLFSRKDKQINDIENPEILEGTALQRARIQLLHTDIADNTKCDASGVHTLMGWALRSIYMRASATPRHAWLAACRAMHIAELLNLHDERKWTTLGHDYNHLRCLFWTLEILNALFSLEIGRSKIQLAYTNCQYPKPRDSNDLLPFFLNLYENFTGDISLDKLEMVLAFSAPHPILALEQANVALILFRRLRPHCEEHNIAQRVLDLGCQLLPFSRELALSGKPWWNVANLPFQLFCSIISTDDSAFIKKLSGVFDTLYFVANTFRTAEMYESTEILRSFLYYFRQKKEQEVHNIGEALNEIESITSFSSDQLYSLPYGCEDMIAGELMPALFGFP